jgi:hypothetical protein
MGSVNGGSGLAAGAENTARVLGREMSAVFSPLSEENTAIIG